ncbi:MAG: T9SS type A sorting domain-containing protein [Bacteroidetes bacterium]|nr:T9SS type A sorting domain-containing protein [Bacteroidota bacterium]
MSRFYKCFRGFTLFFMLATISTLCLTFKVHGQPLRSQHSDNFSLFWKNVYFTLPKETTIMLASARASKLAAFIPPAYLSTSGGVTTVSNYPDYLLFDGYFDVDQPLVFVNCPKMVFHPAATINLDNNSPLTINNCTLQASCNHTWEGIQTFMGSTLTVSNSTLRDMENGLWSKGGSVIACSQNTFDNNWHGIRLEGTGSTYAGTIYNNTFQSTGSYCLAPHTGQKGYMGVRVDGYSKLVNIGGWSGGTNLGNTFNNLQTGIYIYLPAGAINPPYIYNILNNQFANIQGGQYGLPASGGGYPVSLYDDYPGTAIYALSDGATSSATLTVDAPALSTTPHINYCTKGITAVNMHANITKNKISNTIWGILVSRPDWFTYQINNNTLTNVYDGIRFNGMAKAATLSQNTLSSTSQSLSFNMLILERPTGIGLEGFSPVMNNNFVVQNNGISINTTGGTGVNVLNAGCVVSDNTIALTNANTPTVATQRLYGIAVSNAAQTRIHCNTITGNTALINATRPDAAGIYMSDSRNMEVSCNNISLAKYGFQVIGNCATGNRKVWSNTFSNHINGWLLRHLGNPGTLGDVGDPPNDNNNQFMGTVFALQNGFLMKVYTVSNCVLPTNYKIFTSNGTLTQNESGGNNPSCVYWVQGNTSPHNTASCPVNCNITQVFSPMIANVELAEQIAQDSVLYTEYQQGAAWLAAQRLYYDLWQDTAGRNSSTVLDSFFIAMQNTPVGNLRVTDELLDNLNRSFGNDTAAYRQWLTDARNANNFVSSDIQAENEQIINSLYLKYVETGTEGLTTDDSTIIATLALQCPMQAGNAVYKARMLYGLYDHPDYNELTICNTAGYYRGSGGQKGLFDEEDALLSQQYLPSSAQKNLVVYPNPTSGKFRVKYMLEPGQEGWIAVSDLQGREVLRKQLHPMLSGFMLDLSNQPNGIYLYRFIVNGTTRYSGKIELEQ